MQEAKAVHQPTRQINFALPVSVDTETPFVWKYDFRHPLSFQPLVSRTSPASFSLRNLEFVIKSLIDSAVAFLLSKMCVLFAPNPSYNIELNFLPRNATDFAFSNYPTDTYWGQFEEISKYNVHLNFFERMWAAWYAFMQNDVLATGIMSFMMHELVYFGRSLPWMLIDRLPYFNKYKIQNVCMPSKCFFALAHLDPSKKYLPPQNNGTAPNSSSLAILLSNSPKYGQYIRPRNIFFHPLTEP